MNTKALLLHRGTPGSFDVSVHDVIKTTNQANESHFQMGAGRVLGNEEKDEIAGVLTETSSASLTLFDEHILASTAYAIAWWIPAAERSIHFRMGAGKVKTVTFQFPSQVAVFSRGSLYFASVTAKKARPKANTPLFNSPLPNLYDTGRYCTGSAGHNIPTQASVENIPAFERFLFDTVNTHLGSMKPLSNVDNTDDLVEAIEAEKGGFPMRRLVPMGVTLDEWISHIDRNRI